MHNKKVSLLFRLLKRILKLCYPKIKIVGTENLPKEPALYIGNHAQMNGPIICELFFPVERYTWCAGQMMHLKEVPSYAFQDFWSGKPRYSHWFYKLLSYIIAPISVFVFKNANTIAVYKDARVRSTFSETIEKLQEGTSVVIFPEYAAPYNHILCNFQDRFVDVARRYYRKTKREISFVPIYIAPRLHKLFLGKPIRFCATNSPEQERQRICQYLMAEITKIACDLPEHTVIPYLNIPKKDYPTNIPSEVATNAKTSR